MLQAGIEYIYIYIYRERERERESGKDTDTLIPCYQLNDDDFLKYGWDKIVKISTDPRGHLHLWFNGQSAGLQP